MTSSTLIWGLTRVRCKLGKISVYQHAACQHVKQFSLAFEAHASSAAPRDKRVDVLFRLNFLFIML